MNGYILESRSILESDIWKMPPIYFKVWHYLLLKAQFKKYKGLKRGQLFTSIPEIQEACSYFVGARKVTPTYNEVRNVIRWLKKPHKSTNTNTHTSMITTTKATHGMVVTICNFNKYQDFKTYERHTESHNECHRNDKIQMKEDKNTEATQHAPQGAVGGEKPKYIRPPVEEW